MTAFWIALFGASISFIYVLLKEIIYDLIKRKELFIEILNTPPNNPAILAGSREEIEFKAKWEYRERIEPALSYHCWQLKLLKSLPYCLLILVVFIAIFSFYKI